MPPKRPLSTSGNGEEEEEDEQSAAAGGTAQQPGNAGGVAAEPGKKKRKLDPAQQIQAVFDFVRKYKKEDGSLLCESMTRVPNKRSDPGYYEAVENPIDIMKIQQKLKTDEYTNMEEFKADFDLMIKNTRSYHKEGSNENRDAIELEILLAKVITAVQNGDDIAAVLSNREESEENEINEFLEEFLGCIMSAVDPAEPDRHLNTVFQLLPSKRRYPEYYKVISEPIDLKTIAMRIQNGDYASIGDMETDLQLMFSNAIAFNEPGSQIYKDARTLSKMVKSKKTELDASLIAKQNRGAKSSRRQSKQVFSTQLANLAYEDSESEDDEMDEVVPRDDPMWQLYLAVRNFTTPTGNELAEAFLSLPSRRELPDYYKAIAEPISLNLIKRKMKQGEYSSLQDLVEDMDKMFENCKAYNRPDSKLYRDGVRLQKVMHSRLEELYEETDMAPPTPASAATAGSGASAALEEAKKSPKDPKEPLRRRLRHLYNSVLNWTNSDNIQPIGVFMEKPDKKTYPDYYEIISEPIDMNMIDAKINRNIYRSEEEIMSDFKLMFSNCRLYNEEGSAIYEDANILERVLMAKARDMGIITGHPQLLRKKGVSLAQKIRTLYDTLKDYRDAKGRQLSLIFLKLPSKHDYPDYYDIIKRPIDLEKIFTKWRNNVYETLEDAIADFTLVFDNACKYNEPDSQIYKDAQTLQRLAHQTVRHLTEDGDGVPDARAAVQDILGNIYHTVFTAQDSEDRCYADSFAELQEHDEVNGKKVRALSLEIVKRRVDRGLYKRLDLLQRDVFLVLARARRLSRTDSQVFEDSIELQRIFIRARDQHGEGGQRLSSRAYDYTLATMEEEIAKVRALKVNEPAQEEESTDAMLEQGTQDWSGIVDQSQAGGDQYHVGDFIYVMPAEFLEPHVYRVERLFEKEGVKTFWARQFFRQRETFHVPTRTFYEKEVMQGDLHDAVPVSKVLGKCYVMPVKDYFKYRPEGFDEKDVFVCEWRYTSKVRNWKKIKPSHFWDIPAHLNIVARDTPLAPTKVPSVFKDRIAKHKEEVEELEALEKVLEEEVPKNVRWSEGPDASLIYWEQYTIPGPITLRRGDNVLVRGENNRNMIAQIDTMWTGQDGMAYFNGPWFVLPIEVPPQPGRMYYKSEAFLSSISDSNPLLSVVGKCVVLEYKDYTSLRPIQYTEGEVFVCENLFDEGKRIIRPLSGGLKKYTLSKQVINDEVYFFRHPVYPEKEGLSTPLPPPRTSIPSPMLEMMNEDSLDAPPSVGSLESSSSPAPSKKKADPKKKLVTAYILFSADIRKLTMEENPGVKFGEISRIVADRWRQMTDAEKQLYSEKAKKYNEEKEREEARKEEEKKKQADWLANHPGQNLPPKAASPGPVNTPPNPASPIGPARMRQESGGPKLDPLFHTVPPRPQRVQHSEAYIRYIEGLTKESKSMCNWDRQLSASSEVCRVTDESRLPVSWLQNNGGDQQQQLGTTSTEALWALRDFMMQEALGVVRIM